MRKKALITGVVGQDGVYLTRYLLKKGYEVHGMRRRSSLSNTNHIDHLYQGLHAENLNLILHYGGLTDSMNITRLVRGVQPDEAYNPAAMNHIHMSFQTPEYISNAGGSGTPRILEAVRLLGLTNKTHICQTSTLELYGLVQQAPQSERAPFYPYSSYAVVKLCAYWITINYREVYKMHASNGILFSHESSIRGGTFVIRGITRALSRVALSIQDKFYMGSLSSQRDWGHAKGYIRATYLILQQDTPSDYVIATGIATAIRSFIKMAGQEIGLTIGFRGKGVDEKGYIATIDKATFVEKVDEKHLLTIEAKVTNKDEIVVVDSQYFRPTEVDLFIDDPTKLQTILGWKPEYDLGALIEDMIYSDIKLFEHDTYLEEGEFKMISHFE